MEEKEKKLTKTKIAKKARIMAALVATYLFVGAILPYALPRHVSQRTQEAFDRAAFFSDSPGPDRVVLVETTEDAFSRRIELLRSAEQTLDICYYAVDPGVSAPCFFSEVLRAADRGVRVRVLFDGKNASHSSTAWLRMALAAHENIEVRVFNPLRLLTPWKWNVSLHDKFIIADDALLMLGGRNIGDRFLAPPGYDGPISQDRDVVVINTAGSSPAGAESAVFQTRDYMDLLWEADETERLTIRDKDRAEAAAYAAEMHAQRAALEAAHPDYFTSETDLLAASCATDRITLLYNPVSSGKKEPTLGYAMYRLLAECRRIDIQTPYCAAGRAGRQALAGLAANAELTMLTNSIASSPNYPAFSAYLTSRRSLANAGMTIYEYQDNDSIHGKAFVADDTLAGVGAFNLDDRSIYIDTETMLIIDSAEFHDQLSQELALLRAQCAVVGPDGGYLPDGGATPVEAPLGKRLLMYFTAIFSSLLRFLV